MSKSYNNIQNYKWGFGIEHESILIFKKPIEITIDQLIKYLIIYNHKDLAERLKKRYNIKYDNNQLKNIKLTNFEKDFLDNSDFRKEYIDLHKIPKCFDNFRYIQPQLYYDNQYYSALLNGDFSSNVYDEIFFKQVLYLSLKVYHDNIKKVKDKSNKKYDLSEINISKIFLCKIYSTQYLDKIVKFKKQNFNNQINKLLQNFNQKDKKCVLFFIINLYLKTYHPEIQPFLYYFNKNPQIEDYKLLNPDINIIALPEYLLLFRQLGYNGKHAAGFINLKNNSLKKINDYNFTELIKILYNLIFNKSIIKKYTNDVTDFLRLSYQNSKFEIIKNKFTTFQKIDEKILIFNQQRLKKYYQNCPYFIIQNICTPVILLTPTSTSKNNKISDIWLKVYNKKNNKYFNNTLNFLKPVNNINKHINKTLKLLPKSLINYADKLSDQSVPDIDFTRYGKCLEFKTTKFFKVTTKQVVNELIKNENTIIQIFNSDLQCYQKVKNNLQNITTPEYGNIRHRIELIDCKKYQPIQKYDYTGSYHFWFTLPYTSKTTPFQFIENHIKLASVLQMLEPLFISIYMSGDLSGIGNGKPYVKGSYRQLINEHSGYGTSDIRLLRGSKLTYAKKRYFPSIEYFKKNFDILDLYPETNKLLPIYDGNGDIILDYNVLTTRNMTNPIINPLFSSDNSTVYHSEQQLNKISKIKNYLQILSDKKYGINMIGKGFENKLQYKMGADIRTNLWSKNIIPPFKQNWNFTYILYDQNRLVRTYYQVKNGVPYNFTTNPPYDYKKYKKVLEKERLGIEFRIFDGFNVEYIEEIMKIFSLLMVHVLLSKDSITYAVETQCWHNMIAESVMNGYLGNVDKDYRKMLEKEFKIKLGNINTMKDIYIGLVNNLVKKYGNNKMTKMLNGYYIKDIKIEILNKKSWERGFVEILGSCLDIDRQFKQVMKEMKGDKNKTNFEKLVLKKMGNEWRYDILQMYDYYLSKIKSN